MDKALSDDGDWLRAFGGIEVDLINAIAGDPEGIIGGIADITKGSIEVNRAITEGGIANLNGDLGGDTRGDGALEGAIALFIKSCGDVTSDNRFTSDGELAG